MKKRYQNIDLLEFAVNSTTNTIYFPTDRLFCGKKIKRITLLNASHCAYSSVGMPTIPATLMPYLFLDVYNILKQNIVKSLQSLYLVPGVNQDITLNQLLDYTLTTVRMNSNSILTAGVTYSLPVVVEYQTTTPQPFIEPTNAQRIAITPIANQLKYKLSDYLQYSLNNKKIARIIVSGDTNGYLTVRDTDNKIINQLPLAMLTANLETDNTYFDSLLIDFNNSYIETPNELSTTTEITFYYE